MKSIGNKHDSKGFVKFCENNHLIVAGCDGKETFFVNKDGSSSLGGGLNGMSFFSLNDTPSAPLNKKVLGVNGEKVAFLNEIEIDKILVKDINAMELTSYTGGIEKLISQNISTSTLAADSINITNSLDVKNLTTEDINTKDVKANNVIANNIFALESLNVTDVEILGKVSVPTLKIGMVDMPLQICKAESYKFDMKDARKLVLLGRHYNDVLEFIVTSELSDLFDNVIDVHVIDLLGVATSVESKLVKRVDDTSFLVKLKFDKKIDDKQDKLERITVSIN